MEVQGVMSVGEAMILGKLEFWKRKNTEKHFAELVERIMHQTSSGFAVTYVRNGFMGNV